MLVLERGFTQNLQFLKIYILSLLSWFFNIFHTSVERHIEDDFIRLTTIAKPSPIKLLEKILHLDNDFSHRLYLYRQQFTT